MHCGVFQCISVGFGVFRCISVFTLTEKGCKKFISNLFTYFNFIFFFVHKCIHSIIPHQYMYKLCIPMQTIDF